MSTRTLGTNQNLLQGGDEVNENTPPVKIALVIDGFVVDVMHTDDRLASILLSSPTILDVTDIYKGESLTGWVYDGTTLKNPFEVKE